MELRCIWYVKLVRTPTIWVFCSLFNFQILQDSDNTLQIISKLKLIPCYIELLFLCRYSTLSLLQVIFSYLFKIVNLFQNNSNRCVGHKNWYSTTMEERWYKDLLPSCSGEFLTSVCRFSYSYQFVIKWFIKCVECSQLLSTF